MKNVFVAIIEKSLRIDRLEMAKRANSCRRFRVGSVFWIGSSAAPRVAYRATATMIVDRDGFDPVNRVLQNEKLAQLHHDFVGQHRVRWRGADVEKKRTVRP